MLGLYSCGGHCSCSGLCSCSGPSCCTGSPLPRLSAQLQARARQCPSTSLAAASAAARARAAGARWGTPCCRTAYRSRSARPAAATWPAAMASMARHTASVKHGKLCADSMPGYGSFAWLRSLVLRASLAAKGQGLTSSTPAVVSWPQPSSSSRFRPPQCCASAASVASVSKTQARRSRCCRGSPAQRCRTGRCQGRARRLSRRRIQGRPVPPGPPGALPEPAGLGLPEPMSPGCCTHLPPPAGPARRRSACRSRPAPGAPGGAASPAWPGPHL
jgi:hypothetical protein